MEVATKGPQIDKSALIVVDMQNDFVHPDGGFACKSREMPEAEIDMAFLMGTIPQVKRLVDRFRQAGRPVVYIAHVLKADYSTRKCPIGALEFTRARIIAHSSLRILGARRSWMSLNPRKVNT